MVCRSKRFIENQLWNRRPRLHRLTFHGHDYAFMLVGKILDDSRNVFAVIHEVAQVFFVRKRLVEFHYLRTTISDEQRQEFGQLVEDTIRRIESAQFLPHSGIRFPQNPCSSCPYIGLCLGRQDLAEAALVRRPGAEQLGWLDELA